MWEEYLQRSGGVGEVGNVRDCGLLMVLNIYIPCSVVIPWFEFQRKYFSLNKVADILCTGCMSHTTRTIQCRQHSSVSGRP